MMGHDSIASHLQMNFHLMIKAHMSLETISNMMPWERIIYINLYIQDIENESGINSPGWLRYQKRIK